MLAFYVYVLTGPPDDITGIHILPDTITACSFVVQWNEPSSDPVCGTVWYTVTISTEGGILIITDNTTMTNYSVTGLNSSTLYSVNVTASNNAGSSDTNGTSVITNSGSAIGKILLYSTVCISIGDSKGGHGPPAKFYSDCSIREYRSIIIIYKCAYSDCSIREY